MTRRALEDLELGGYRIPKGTTMVMNLWGLHRDPRYYPEPAAAGLHALWCRAPALHRGFVRPDGNAHGAGGHRPAVSVGSAP